MKPTNDIRGAAVNPACISSIPRNRWGVLFYTWMPKLCHQYPTLSVLVGVSRDEVNSRINEISVDLNTTYTNASGNQTCPPPESRLSETPVLIKCRRHYHPHAFQRLASRCETLSRLLLGSRPLCGRRISIRAQKAQWRESHYGSTGVQASHRTAFG